MTYLKKIIVPILMICLVGLTTGPVLLFPSQAQAGCPVSIVADSDSPAETGWNAKDVIYEGKDIVQQYKQTAIQLWDKSKQMLKWAVGKALNTLLHRLLANMTNDITNWIQNGEEPRFISEGLSDYLWDIADQAGGDFVENYLGLGWMCEPFDMEIKTALLDVPTFEEEVTCTLSDVVDNIDDFYNDFSKGGWAGWIELTKPQNNFYGAFLLAEKKKIEEIEKAKAEAEADALMGRGALSMKDCKWYDKNGNLMEEQTDVRGQPAMPQTCIDNTELRPCTYKCETLTPSSLVDETAKKASTNYMDQLNAQIAAATEKAGPFQVYVQAIVNALINRVMTEGVGLLRAGTEDDPRGSFTKPVYGDLGVATSTPAITDPLDIMEEQTDANLVIGQLEILQEDLGEMMEDIQERIDNLEAAYEYYDIYTRASLIILKGCGLPGYKTWAIDKLNELDTEILIDIQDEIDSLEAFVSPTTAKIISDAIALTNTFISEGDDWLEVWEDVGGNAGIDSDGDGTSDLEEAEEDVDEARDAAIEKVQEVVTKFNGSCSSSDFKGLAEEVETVVKKLTDTVIELNVDPDDNSELSGAKALEAETDRYGADCENYKQEKKDLEKALKKIKIEVKIILPS